MDPLEIGTTVDILSGVREGQSGTLELILNGVYFVAHDEIGLRPYWREEIAPKPVEPVKSVQKRSKRSKDTENPASEGDAPEERRTSPQATRAVLRNLDKDVPDAKGTAVWETLIAPDTDLETFRQSACAYLGEVSSLKDSTIQGADWTYVFTYYKDMMSAD